MLWGAAPWPGGWQLLTRPHSAGPSFDPECRQPPAQPAPQQPARTVSTLLKDSATAGTLPAASPRRRPPARAAASAAGASALCPSASAAGAGRRRQWRPWLRARLAAAGRPAARPKGLEAAAYHLAGSTDCSKAGDGGTTVCGHGIVAAPPELRRAHLVACWPPEGAQRRAEPSAVARWKGWLSRDGARGTVLMFSRRPREHAAEGQGKAVEGQGKAKGRPREGQWKAKAALTSSRLLSTARALAAPPPAGWNLPCDRSGDRYPPCVVRGANMGHQLAGGNCSCCPELESGATHCTERCRRDPMCRVSLENTAGDGAGAAGILTAGEDRSAGGRPPCKDSRARGGEGRL